MCFFTIKANPVLLAGLGTGMFFLLASATPLSGGEDTKTLVTFQEEPVPIMTWLKQNDWKSKRHNPARFEVGEGVLKMVSRDDSVMIGTEKGFPLDAANWPRIRLQFQVTKTPVGTDLTRKSGDDAALRVFLGFGQPKGFFRPPISLAYAWTEDVPEGTIITSPHFSYVKVISIGEGTTDQWVTIERDLVKDFRAAFPGEELLPLTGILLKCDSNNTGTSAEARIRSVELLAPEPVTPVAP